MKSFTGILLGTAALGLAFVSGASAASDGYAYPVAGQVPEQQTQGRFECYTWAINQSGFDPTTAEPLPAPTHSDPTARRQDRHQRNRGLFGIGDGGFFQGGGLLGDAASGAALGAAGGAIAGDAGAGAAIGALASTLFGALNRARNTSTSRQPSADYDDALIREQARIDRLYRERRNQHDNYRSAYNACLAARGHAAQ